MFFVFCFNPNFGPAAISLHKICYGFSVFFCVWDKDGGDLGLILHFSGSCVVGLSLMKKVRWTQELWVVVGWISADPSSPGSRFDNSVIPQWAEPSINVTWMNLILAVLFLGDTDLVWVICTKYLGNQTNLLFHLAKSSVRTYNHSA